MHTKIHLWFIKSRYNAIYTIFSMDSGHMALFLHKTASALEQQDIMQILSAFPLKNI